MRPRATGIFLGSALMLGLLGTGSAWATFPGLQGRVAYLRDDNELSLTGTGQVIAHPPGAYDLSPSFSPDGTRIAFVRQTIPNGLYSYQVMIVNNDGTHLHSVASASLFGVNGYGSVNSTAWTADGRRVSFYVQGDLDQSGVWTVGSDGSGLTRTVAATETYPGGGLNWSPVGKQLVYGCAFRTNGDGDDIPDLCVLDAITDTVHRLPIDWDGRDRFAPSDPKWTPDGRRILFAMRHNAIQDPNIAVTQDDIFSIDGAGGKLTKLSNSGPPICATYADDAGHLLATPTFEFGSPLPSPSGSSIRVFAIRNVPARPDCLYDSGVGGTTRSTEAGVYELGTGGMRGAPVQVPAAGSLDWEPVPPKLLVRIDDGHDHPLTGLKVELTQEEDVHVPTGEEGGSYAFGALPSGDYVLRVTLIDNRPTAGHPPAFRIDHDVFFGEPVWIERNVTVPVGIRSVVDVSFEESPAIADANVYGSDRQRLDDLAFIYYRVRQFVDWVRTHLTLDTGPTVVFHAFAIIDALTRDPVNTNTAYYRHPTNDIHLGINFSDYANRATLLNQAPENGEWHEFTHHLFATFVHGGLCAGHNHQGFLNEDSCDALKEGFAEFLPAFASRDIEGATDSLYGNLFDLESQFKAWGGRVGAGGILMSEEDAVGALFWDLADASADSETTLVVGEDGLHHPVTLVDTQNWPLAALWNVMTLSHPDTVHAFRAALGIPPVTVDLDGDLVADVAPLDEVFLMHGYFPVNVEQQLPGHTSLHYDVAAAQRESPGSLRNSGVSLSDHLVVDGTGGTLNIFIPRLNTPLSPTANLGVDVRDASGTPLAGATVELTVQAPGVPVQTVPVSLDAGSGALVHIELPPYFETLLPVGAGLPPCDPATDVHVDVMVRTTLNGFVSSDTAAFDNCTYQQAAFSATGPAALGLTAGFPEDSTPPATSIVMTPTGSLSGGATTGSWIVETSCADPEVGGFASGCFRTEYRLDGGPLTPFAGSIAIAGVGHHVLDLRSADGAGNEEPFQSLALDVATPPDSDGDGLSDDVEDQLGTSPDDPDSDDDGLMDGDEAVRGTNPLATDSDDDGLGDGVEVGLGTNPLAADTDGDGLTDGAEVAAGTDPLDPDSDDDGVIDGTDNCGTRFNEVQRDSDGDGAGDVCDNCPAAWNQDQADGDGDEAGDACDCRPSDSSQRVPAAPDLVAAQNGASIVLSWVPVAGADGYAVTRGDRPGLPAGDFGTCLASTATTTFADPEGPPVGGMFIYLVQGESLACGIGSAGFASNEMERVNSDPDACRPAVVTRQALSETSVASTTSGSFFATQEEDSFGETVYEALIGSAPSEWYGLLDHRFTFDVAPGDVIDLLVRGQRAQTGDGDDFRFEWSTDGTTFTSVPMESLPLRPQSGLVSGPLPTTLAGPVTIRVVDTVHTPGSDPDDWVWIDWLAVRSTSF